MRWGWMLAACTVMGAFSGCVAAAELEPFDSSRVILLQNEPLIEGEDIAVLSTDAGEIRMRFFPSEAPNAVENFIQLARDGYYDGRSIYANDELPCDEVLLAGGSQDLKSGKSDVNGGRPFKPEVSANLWHFTGAVSVLGNRNGKGDSRFFITGSREVPEDVLEEMEESDYPESVVEAFRTKGGAPEFALEYSIFAQVVEGQEVVDRIIQGLQEKEEFSILSVQIVKYEEAQPED